MSNAPRDEDMATVLRAAHQAAVTLVSAVATEAPGLYGLADQLEMLVSAAKLGTAHDGEVIAPLRADGASDASEPIEAWIDVGVFGAAVRLAAAANSQSPARASTLRDAEGLLACAVERLAGGAAATDCITPTNGIHH